MAGCNFPMDHSFLKMSFPVHEWLFSGGSKRELNFIITGSGRNILNRPDPNGDTPLHLAFILNKQEQCKLLMRAGASTSLRNKHGFTVFNELKVIHVNNQHFDRNFLKQFWSYCKVSRKEDLRMKFIDILNNLSVVNDFSLEINVAHSNYAPILTTVPIDLKIRIFKKNNKLRFDINEMSRIVTLSGNNNLNATVSIVSGNQVLHTIERSQSIFQKPVFGEEIEPKLDYHERIEVNWFDFDKVHLQAVPKGYFNSQPKKQRFMDITCNIVKASKVFLIYTEGKSSNCLNTSTDDQLLFAYRNGKLKNGCSKSVTKKEVNIEMALAPEHHPFGINPNSLKQILALLGLYNLELLLISELANAINLGSIPLQIKWSPTLASRTTVVLSNFQTGAIDDQMFLPESILDENGEDDED